MALISVANLQKLTDKLAYIYDRWKAGLGVHTGSAIAGTDRYLADRAITLLTATVDDYQQQLDMSQQFFALSTLLDRKDVARKILQPALGSIQEHVSQRGPSVATSVADLPSFLTYYNGGTGGAAFSSMLHPAFGDLYYDIYGSRLPSAGLFHPGIHPHLDSTYSAGMGTRAVGGSFTDGAAYEATPLYAELEPLLEITTTFAGGSAPPSFSVAGLDNTGAALNWTATAASNNPAAAISTTATPALVAMSRQTFALASAAGVIPGSVLRINAGLPDEEAIVVEAVATNDITAVCKLAHSAGAAVTGFTTLSLTPGTSGRRCRDVTGITITVAGHSAGTVRVVGRQQRQYNPDL